MNLVQLLLPLRDNAGTPFARAEFESVVEELTERFGGATAYVRAPAKGTWKEDVGAVEHDEMLMIEVMAEELDRRWWASYRQELAQRFRQEDLVVRALPMERL